jgi:hypothetical protein
MNNLLASEVHNPQYYYSVKTEVPKMGIVLREVIKYQNLRKYRKAYHGYGKKFVISPKFYAWNHIQNDFRFPPFRITT